MLRFSPLNGFMRQRLSGESTEGVSKQRYLLISSLVGIAVFLLLVAIVSDAIPFTGALFQIGSGTNPASGLYVSRRYEALPNERGSIVVQAGQGFTNMEGFSLSVVVDPLRAEILRVRRTAATQQFSISMSYPAPGIVKVALVGAPRAVAPNTQLLEVELQLKDSTVNRSGNRIDVRLLGVRLLSNGNQITTEGHDGLITFVSNQNALSLPFVPMISDVEPGILPLVSARTLTIHGKAFPASPRVLLGSRAIPVRSASPTEIIATIPEDLVPGVYSVAVESLLAEETVVVFGSPGTAGAVDIVDELLFADPNPVLYTAANTAADLVLWIPVFNPLGSTDAIEGSVDLSALGGDPDNSFQGVGTSVLGPSGERINWFRFPAQGAFSLPEGLETNVDYPVTVRVENRSGTTDTALMIISLRAQIPQGDAPAFGPLTTVPSLPAPGDETTFYTDISDADGVDSLILTTIRLTALGGSVQNLDPAISLPSNVSLRTAPFTTEFTIPRNVTPGTYQLELRAVDDTGNETVISVPFTVTAPGDTQRGQPPQFVGRKEARPPVIGPGGTVDFFVGLRDPDGTDTIDIVTIDLVDVGGDILELSPLITSDSIGTLPVTYQGTFDLPSGIQNGSYMLSVRAVDVNGLSAETTIPLTVDASLGGGGTGNPPEFLGRLEAKPNPVGLGGETTFFVSVRDRDGSDSIEKVSVDLVDIGGTELELEAASDPVGGSIEPVLFIGEFNLPSTIPPGAYALPIRAFDDDGNATRTTLNLLVSAIAPQTSVPSILQALSIPAQVPADNKTETMFRIEVEDSDGVEDITVARINLSPIGLGIATFDLQSDAAGELSTRGFFDSRPIKIPTFVKSGGYDLLIEVEDTQGNRAQRTLRLTVGPLLGGDAPMFRESRFVPETANPGGNVRLYADIEDLNGADGDSLTVIADFTEVRLDVEELTDLVNFPSGTLVTRNTFVSPTMSLPEDLPVGVYDIPLMVTDDTNNVVRTIARLRVERGNVNSGQEPRIDVTRTFQVPRIIANDDDAEGELHVLVQDPDDDVSTVIVNMGSIGRADSASVSSNAGDLDLLCRSSSSIVCMERGALENLGSRWFILKGITIPPTTIAGNDPYLLDVTAVDDGGHAVQGQIPLLIGNPEDAQALAKEPVFELVVPVSATQIELVLSSPVDPSNIDRSGGQFIIKPALNAFSSLGVRNLSWDTTGRYLYLQTDPLTPGETYILSVKPVTTPEGKSLTDIRGNRFAADRGGKITFTYRSPGTVPPQIERVDALDAEHLSVRFKEPVLPSSVHPDLLSARASLVSIVTGESRRIRDSILTEGGKVLLLLVEPLREGDRYRLRIEGVLAPGLIEAPDPGVEKIFIAIFRSHQAAGPIILPTADLNHDGRVDFADFALFSAVYNTEYDLQDIETLLPFGATEEEEEGSGFQFGGRQSSSSRGGTNRSPLGGELPDLRF